MVNELRAEVFCNTISTLLGEDIYNIRYFIDVAEYCGGYVIECVYQGITVTGKFTEGEMNLIKQLLYEYGI